jgi:predicted metal-dependent hydrolase
MVNAQGIVPAYIEPFLIKVMRRAQERLDPERHAELLADLDVFNRQEAQHYQFHVALNRWIRDNGYEGMAEHERTYADEYDEMLATRSLRWLLAYCEGFEAMGLASAHAYVDGAVTAGLTNADPRPVALWRWHLAEEYEHRTVAFRVLKALYGRDPVVFYLVRLSGLFHAVRHIGPTVSRLRTYLLQAYAVHEGLAEPPRARRGMWVPVLRQAGGLLRALSPTYDPERVRAPALLDDALDAPAVV